MYDEASDVPRCSVCGYVTDSEFVNPRFRLSRKTADVSFTYDNRCIVSQRFRAFCLRRNCDGVVFVDLANDPGWYALISRKVLTFDSERYGTRFQKQCPVCRRFESVTGASPAMLRNQRTAIPDGIYRTDIEFGSGDEKSPSLIVGKITGERIKAAKFRQVVLEAIEEC